MKGENKLRASGGKRGVTISFSISKKYYGEALAFTKSLTR